MLQVDTRKQNVLFPENTRWVVIANAGIREQLIIEYLRSIHAHVSRLPITGHHNAFMKSHPDVNYRDSTIQPTHPDDGDGLNPLNTTDRVLRCNRQYGSHRRALWH